MRPPRRILFVDHARALGGAEHSLLGLISALDPARYRVHLACQSGALAERASAMGIPHSILPLRRLKGGASALWRWPRGSLSLARLARQQGAAIIHANVLRAAIYAAPAAAIARRPLLWHVRDILAPGATSRRLCARAAQVVAISKAVAQALPCGAMARVVYNPITWDAAGLPASDAPSRAELGLPASGPLVACVGRLRRWKGQTRFLETAAALATKHPEASFLIIGSRVFDSDDEDRDYPGLLESKIQELGLAGRAHLLGQRDDMAKIWPHLSILLHAADAEPFGRVAAEAQLAGLPVVAFADGGLPEIIVDGETGLLAAPGEISALTDRLDSLLSNPRRASTMGRAGRDLARRRYDPARHAAALMAIYDAMLEPTGPGVTA